MCDPIDTVDSQIRKLADDMLETMYDAPGVGLAGPQIGITKRIFVIDCAEKDSPAEPLVLINPELTWESEETNIHEEGCLSIPGEFEDVSRPAEVRMRYLDQSGKLQEREFAGLSATAVQHELDHLNGTLFIDYLSGLKRRMITTRMKKLKKEKART